MNMLSDNTANDGGHAIVQSELLCFVRDKCLTMARYDIVKLCGDFYNEEEVLQARSTIESFTKQRLPKRKGSDRCKSSLEDIVKVCLDPAVSLPIFCAVKLNRLPPVDAAHCDVSAILAELSSLRLEVKTFSNLQSEIDSLRYELQLMKSNPTRSETSVAAGTVPPPDVLKTTSTDHAAANSGCFVQKANDLAKSGIQPSKRNGNRSVINYEYSCSSGKNIS